MFLDFINFVSKLIVVFPGFFMNFSFYFNLCVWELLWFVAWETAEDMNVCYWNTVALFFLSYK